MMVSLSIVGKITANSKYINIKEGVKIIANVRGK
jgi:hypothetical protein